MTMVLKLRSRAFRPVRVAGGAIVALVAWLGLAASLPAEQPPVHFNHAGIMRPGAIGNQQLQRGGPLPGYFQPVEVSGPEGLVVETAESGQFSDPQAGPVRFGLLIGAVYRLRVTGIPLQEGLEVYPTIEVIDRLYPPMGMEFKFPIPIELTQEELEMALDGKFVTRVIYLEDPEAAVPAAQEPNDQPYFDVREGESPIDLADGLGRPMAILRMGGRLPDSQAGPDAAFMYGCPPLLRWRPRLVNHEWDGPLVRATDQPIQPASARTAVPVPFARGVRSP
ncbi:MAG: hypothetical protein WD845_05550 [Pirellulales bacterium]